MRDFVDDIRYFGIWVALAIGGLALIVAPIYLAEKHGCSRQAAGLGVEHRFGWAEGCLFESGGRFVPEDIYRLNEQVGR